MVEYAWCVDMLGGWVILIKEEIGRSAQVHYCFRSSLERSELNGNGQVFHARAKINSVVGLVAP